MYTTLLKPSSIQGCLSLAEQAIVSQGLQLLKGADGQDYLVVGGSGDVTLTIVCAPFQNATWVMISASSHDQMIAAQARDVFRGIIEGTPVA
ncbi:MAG: hypothetical protein U0790_13555 [Isosphaeraceae bacterium]